MGPGDLTEPATDQHAGSDTADWPGEGWAPDEDREEYVDLAALERLQASRPALAGDPAPWTAPAADREDGTNSEGEEYDPDEDPDADPDRIDPLREHRPETD